MKYITKVRLNNKIFKIYKLGALDIPFFKDFYSIIIDNLKGIEKEFSSHYDYKLLKKDIESKSVVYMVYYREKPVAYSLVYIPNSKNISNWLKNCKIDKTDKTRIAELAGAGVIPEFRGYGIQSYLFKLREKYLKKINFKWGVCSVHPKNIYSYNNLVKNNYTFISSGKDKLNRDRLYFKKEIK
ncbi:MAG: hypothetical protein WCF78_00565 [archaeon]